MAQKSFEFRGVLLLTLVGILVLVSIFNVQSYLATKKQTLLAVESIARCQQYLLELTKVKQLENPDSVIRDSGEWLSEKDVIEQAKKHGIQLKYKTSKLLTLHETNPQLIKVEISFQSDQDVMLISLIQFLEMVSKPVTKNTKPIFVESIELEEPVQRNTKSHRELWHCKDLTLSYFQLTDASLPRGKGNPTNDKTNN